MKSYLCLCLSESSFTDFPTRMSRTKNTKFLATLTHCTYCSCRIPKVGEIMKCDAGKECYHIVFISEYTRCSA